jgi:hypothetical protein
LIGSGSGGHPDEDRDPYRDFRGPFLALFAGMAVRQFLDDAREEAPDVVAVRLAATHTASGVAIDFELTDRAGHAVGGGSL